MKLLRKINPGHAIVGPSAACAPWGQYCDPTKDTWLRRFFEFAKKTDTVPDIVSWHEMGCSADTKMCGGPPAAPGDFTGQSIPAHARAIRDYLRDNKLLSSQGGRVKSMHINEYMNGLTWTRPGPTLAFMANIERAAAEGVVVEGVITNQWQMVVGGMFSVGYGGHGSMAAPSPDSAWWLQKAYGDLAGTLVNTSASWGTLADAIASYAPGGPGGPEARILVGSFSAFTPDGTRRPPSLVGPRNLTLRLANVPPELGGGSASAAHRVSVQFRRIAWSNSSAAPVASSFTLQGGGGGQPVDLVLPPLGPNDAAEVILQPAGF